MDKYLAPVTYIPLEKFHIVPITGFTPAELKISARKTIKDREDISHTTKLNALAKSLGIKGGFAAYEKEYNEKLVPFMQEHNLQKRQNLLTHKKLGECSLFLPFNHQKVSERLFYFDGQMPNKLFTGHNFDFSKTFGWHSQDLHFSLIKDEDWYHIIKGNYHKERAIDDDFHFSSLSKRQQQLLELDLKTEIPVNLSFQSTARVSDLILLENRDAASCIYHLLGNALTNLPLTSVYIQSYQENKYSAETVSKWNKADEYLQKLLIERINESSDGWVEIIPYNENIIFLSDNNGNYDFVIKNQRNNIFEHQIFEGYLKRADIPSFIEDYRFERWHYFNYQGNRELDSHCSEQHYYKNGGTAGNYHSNRAILRQYYQDKKIYQPRQKAFSTRLNGFTPIVLDEKIIMVSELISIGEITDFVVKNSDYINYRYGNSLKFVNSDPNVDLPASCHYFDVLAYINWLEKETKIPLRLLSYSEYKEIRGEHFSPVQRGQESDMIFYSSDGKKFDGHPHHISNIEYPRDSLHLRYPDPLKFLEINGLKFINSDHFCEWLLEGGRIRSVSLSSLYQNGNIIGESGFYASSGKNYGVKTGFRLCYELKKHQS